MATRNPRLFYANVVLEYDGDECLVWPYHRDPTGYGRMDFEGKKVYIHRLVCEHHYGTPPSGYQAAHKCGNGHGGCVNPKHLRWATPTENAADRVIHGTAILGEQSTQAKLKDGDVREIRSLVGTCSQRALAKRFSVSQVTVNKILTGKIWKHVA